MAHLNYNPVSLKDMAIRRLAAALFKESSILASISNFHSKFSPFDDYETPQVWRETVEDKLLDEISKVGLPKSLKMLLIDIVKLMGRQVRGWKEFHEEYLHDSHGEEIHFDEPILEKLRWTAAGAVDYRKTAGELIHSDFIDIVKRYKLACLYCMEDCIPMFWKELPSENKQYFCRKTDRRLQSGGLGLEFWWPYIIKGQESNLDSLTRSNREDQISVYQYAFQCSAKKGNKAAAEYFFQKLKPEEKGDFLMSTTRTIVEFDFDWNRIFPLEKFSELFVYLLSVMTPDQQMRIFQELPFKVLRLFLKWPLQDIFSEIAELIWDFLPKEDYNSVLSIIDGNFKDSDHYCLKLFEEFFNFIPPDFWNSFVDRQCEKSSYFDDILSENNIKALEIFFRSLDAAARTRLVFSVPALENFICCLSIGKRDVVEVCLREASFSMEDRKRLKEAFMGYLRSLQIGSVELKTRKWSRYFHFLDETNEPSKRCSEDETRNDAKKRKT
ncbi:hypothetical protein AVEN_44802-1 [Araneus ventricosus]|uniref:Uncharacterized protein n=1 Tax=Araneus ventricosus TaxID=182803 RepID=A0A4Y2WNS1_ARAVE|nr:hypothetical protein AVEN_44802-1 [Araneus ventricosus]